MAKKQVRSKDGSTIYIEHVPMTTHKICSIFPMDLSLETKVVPGCNEKTPKENLGVVGGVRYSFVEVGPKASRVFVGGGKNDTWEVRLDVTAYDHARDMIGWVFSDNSDEPSRSGRLDSHEGRGLFVPKGEEPTLEELAEARRKQLAFYEQEAQKAQSWWAVNRNMRNITELQVLAAKELGHKYEWMAGESRLEKKSEAEVLAEAIGKLIASQQQVAAPVAATAQRK